MTVPFFAARNGSWIRSTPAHDGTSLFVGGMRDVLVCLDCATGKERWRVDFVERYQKGVPSFGMVCSPMVRGDHVYVQAGAAFCKLDKHTGATLWRSLEDGGGMMGGSFSSPVFATLAGREQLVVQTRSHLAGVDDASGDVLWNTPVRTFRGMNILTPLPWKDGVFTSAYGGRGHYFAVAETEGGDEQSGGASVSEVWQNRLQAYMTSPVAIGDHGYVYLRSKRFACFELSSGGVCWISEPMGDTYWSIVSQGERMLALTDGGELLLIAANPRQLEIVDRITVAESSSWAHLAADGDQLFVRDLEGVTAFEWQREARKTQ